MNKFLTNRQISIMLYSIIVEYSIINVPKDLGEEAGTGSWVSLLIATILFMLITYIIVYLQYVYEGKTVFEYSEILVGKSITFLFMSIYIIYFSIFLSMIVRIYCETIKLIILNKTPVILLSLIFFLVIGYAVSKGINVIARLCEIYVPLNIIGTIFITSLLATQGNPVNLKPLFSNGELMNYLKAVKDTLRPFLGMEILLFIPISRTDNKNIFRYTLLMIGFIGSIFIYVVESTFSVVGVESVVYLKATMLSVLKGVDVYGIDIIRRLDGLYIIVWTMNIICAMCLWAYGIIAITSRTVKRIKYNFMVIIIIFICFVVSQIPKTMEQIELILNYNSYFGIVTFFVIPFILFIITKIKN